MMNRWKIKNCSLVMALAVMSLGSESRSDPPPKITNGAKRAILGRYYLDERRRAEQELKNPVNNVNLTADVNDSSEHPQTNNIPVSDAGAVQRAAAESEEQNIEAYRENQKFLERRADETLRAAERAAKERAEKEAALRVTTEGRDKNQRLVLEARKAVESGKLIPDRVIENVDDKKVKNHLIDAAVAQDLRQEQREKEKKSALNLAKLLEMAAITMQAATAMNSMEGTNAAPNAQTFDPTKAVAPKAALPGRSLASQKEGTVSSKSEDPAAAAEEGETSAKDKETLAKIKTELEAAEKRKQIYNLRKNKMLRDKIMGRGEGTGAGAVDTEELFGGSLRQGMVNRQAEEAGEESVAKEQTLSAPSVFQAVKEGFSLAGAETDREVGELVSEAERNLSSEEMSSGVLGRESPSLFARVRAIHQACQRDKRVVSK